MSECGIGDIATWVGSAVAVFGIVYAIIKETWNAERQRPRLDVRLDERSADDCTENPKTSARAGSVYVRMWIRNVGKSHAEQVMVFADELRRDGQKVAGFIPMRLLWTHTEAKSAEAIFAHTGHHCEFGYLADISLTRPLKPDHDPAQGIAGFSLSTEKPQPNGIGVLTHGQYELDLTIAARNSRAHRCTAAIHVPRTWANRAELQVRGGPTREVK